MIDSVLDFVMTWVVAPIIAARIVAMPLMPFGRILYGLATWLAWIYILFHSVWNALF